MILAQE